jgi:predicted acetyltransferase
MGGITLNIVVKTVTLDQKSVLKNLLELYAYDFTEFVLDDVDFHGLYGYKYLDHYWTEEGRYPFMIYSDGNIAGFVLIRRYFDNDLSDNIYSMAEFFIMKKYRKQGIGKSIAFEVFNMFPGLWEVAVLEENKPAQIFWERVLHNFTKGNFDVIHKEGWNGPVQRFYSNIHK